MNKNKRTKGKTLAQKYKEKKFKKAVKLGKFLYKCVGGADQPAGCNNEWSSLSIKGHPEHCPKCGNQYFKWLNYGND